MRRLSETGKCILTWRPDGTVTKELAPAAARDRVVRERFAYEVAVSGLLARDPPPVPFARLLSLAGQGHAMCFEAIAGEPCGPKWPQALDHAIVRSLLELCGRLESYRPSAPWIRRYDPLAELCARHTEGVVDRSELDRVRSVIVAGEWPASFAHGDLTPRNALWTDGRPTLIDWEFAGWYPLEYDRAFLWMVLEALPDERAFVEGSVPDGRRSSFWLCAYLIQLLHLAMLARRGPGSPFLRRQLDTRERCLRELTA